MPFNFASLLLISHLLHPKTFHQTASFGNYFGSINTKYEEEKRSIQNFGGET